MLPTRFLTVNFGALVDLVKACRYDHDRLVRMTAVDSSRTPNEELEDARWHEGASANRRALAIIIAGAYGIDSYRAAFGHLSGLLDRTEQSNAQIASALLQAYGQRRALDNDHAVQA